MSTVTPAVPPDAPSDGAALSRSYGEAAGVFDELVTGDGAIRPQWQTFLSMFRAMSDEDRAHARASAARLLRENGVLYVAGDTSDEGGRPWQLDLLPLIIGEAEWRELEAGLVQRAHLLNRILADLYGPRRLLSEGQLPPALVFGSPQFLRPCQGLAVPGELYLHFLAFDLARASDGRWWVLSDRTQVAAGAGYALENRIVAARCLSGLFAAHQVQRLAAFFRSFSENLLQLSRRDEPIAVVLSPGPTRATYFEHAYLARYLGFDLVEGADLTVRDSRLFLKTVGGLKPVDLVIRRVDSDLCDPLELRTDSLLGVPGLVQAARAGHVVIANALGSGLVENEGLLPFLPQLSQFLLGEELKLPSVATWWCGQEAERQHVVDNIDRLVIRQTFSPKTLLTPHRGSYVGSRLSAEQRAELVRHIDHRGYGFIGQEILPLSTAPVWSEDGGLTPAPMTLRVYVAATTDGYRVMPGGLTRVAAGSEPTTPWMEAGSFSKDTWVLSETPVDTFSLLNLAQHDQRLRRGGRDLPSGAADNLFWLGRYVERSEGAVRLLRSLVTRLGGEGGGVADPVALERLVSLLVLQEHLSARRAKRAVEGGLRAVESELWPILFDPDCPDGLAMVLGNVRRTAELVRERLSIDIWQTLKALTEIPGHWRLSPGGEVDDAVRLLNLMIQHLAALNGMVMENMTRGFGWRFLDMGRRLERMRHAAKVSRHLVGRGDPEGQGTLALLLELADSSMTYRTRYMAAPHLPAVLDLLLADDTNPRSVMFQLRALEEHMAAMPHDESEATLGPAQRILTRLGADLRLANMVRLAEDRTRAGLRSSLDRLLRRVDDSVHKLSDVIARTHFSHSMPQHISGPQRRDGP